MNDRCKVSPDCFPAIFNLIEKHTPVDALHRVSGSFPVAVLRVSSISLDPAPVGKKLHRKDTKTRQHKKLQPQSQKQAH